MKNKTHQNKSLRISSETVRKLSLSQLAEVAGGNQSNNGCGSHGTGATFCLACQV